ncbi:MAG: segregation and condensation protein [Candidatus Woesearchaeota archaeon]|nr:segregation and condensation protein [Candidatus Woesearchaeota archaeon]
MIEAKEIIQWFSEDTSLSWRDIIYKIVKEKNIDPWDVDVSLLAKEYLNTVKTLKEFNFQISGDIILTAAILLKYKSKKLIDENLKNFEDLLSSAEEDSSFFMPEFFEDYGSFAADTSNFEFEPGNASEDELILKPRIPQSRQRKVYLNDLIDALENALSVKKKHVSRVLNKGPEMTYEKKSLFDIRAIVNQVFEKVLDLFKKLRTPKIKYSTLVSDSKSEKIQTFVALIHLDFHEKVELEQKESFGEIEVLLKDKENKIKI